MDKALYACRFVQFTSAMVVFGGSAFRFYALGSGRPQDVVLAAFDGWLRRVALMAALLALVSALGLLLCHSALMAGSAVAALDPDTVNAVLFKTRFGRIWCWHLLIALSLVLVCLGRPRGQQQVILTFSLLLLASLGWIGHAAMEEGSARIAHELNQTVHLLAAGLWLGGQVPLGWLLRRSREQLGDANDALTRDAIRHFSQIGYAAVALIALTGTINSLLLVGSFGAMVGTAYGQLLALKILLFLAMVGVALINRFHLAPRIFHDTSALGTLCGMVGLEQGLGLCILAVISVLGTWPPTIHGGQ